MTAKSEPGRSRPASAAHEAGDLLGARPACSHEVVTTSDLMAGPGGEMHEVGLCEGCGSMLRRFSPLEPWSSAEDGG